MFLKYQRQPQYSIEWKMTSIIFQIEDNLNFVDIEDDLNKMAKKEKKSKTMVVAMLRITLYLCPFVGDNFCIGRSYQTTEQWRNNVLSGSFACQC